MPRQYTHLPRHTLGAEENSGKGGQDWEKELISEGFMIMNSQLGSTECAMGTMVEEPQNDHVEKLSRLFYSFRMAQLNRRYYSERLLRLKRWDTLASIIVAVSTAASFAVLSFADFAGVKSVAALLAVIAFLASVAAPAFRLERKIDDASTRICAFHYAAQQLELGDGGNSGTANSGPGREVHQSSG